MSAVKAAAQELRGFLERIERLEEERKTLADDIAEYITYDPATGIFTNKKQRRRSKV